jgi:hypothetical protein
MSDENQPAPPPPSGAPVEAALAPVAPPAPAAPAPLAPPAGPPSAGAPPLVAATPAPRRGLPLGAILGIVGGGVVLLLAVALVVAFVVVPRLAPSAPDASPDGAVGAYLAALSKGDAKTALRYLGTTEGDRTLLTSAVATESHKLGAIAAIKVNRPAASNPYGTTVLARYTLGGAPVIAPFDVRQKPDKTWAITDGIYQLDLSGLRGLPITVNGVAVTGSPTSVPVFPGTYQLGTTSKYFSFGDAAPVAISTAYADMSDVRPTLSADGVAAFKAAVTAAVNACVASTSLTAGCGLDLEGTSDNGFTIVDGSLHRSLSADAQTTLANLQPDTDDLDPTDVTGDYIGEVDVDAQCSSEPCSLIGGEDITEPHVDFTTDPPTVRWDQ